MANDGSDKGLVNMAQEKTPEENNSVSGTRSVDSRWQRRLLPFLVGTLGLLTILFCVAIALETRYIQSRMESALEVDLRPAVSQEFRTNGAFLLEANLIERRYRAANVAALSRIYLVFLGFGTGMVMAMVGATFVLGKITEQETSIDGEGSSFKASLHSGSPGIVLAFFGTVLMLSTIFSKTDISLSDRAVYMGTGSDVGATAEPVAEPKIPEGQKPEDKGSPAGTQKTAAATQVASAAKDGNMPPDLHLSMATPETLDGDYSLKAFSGPGTLRVHGHEVQFAGGDGKKRQVEVGQIDRSHVVFTVVEPDGGRQQFDGFLTPQGDIAGSTTYKGSYSTNPSGFTATRVKKK